MGCVLFVGVLGLDFYERNIVQKYKLNSIDGEMEESMEGEWIHVDDLSSDPVSDQLWVTLYLKERDSKYNSRSAVLLANNAVKDYDKRN